MRLSLAKFLSNTSELYTFMFIRSNASCIYYRMNSHYVRCSRHKPTFLITFFLYGKTIGPTTLLYWFWKSKSILQLSNPIFLNSALLGFFLLHEQWFCNFWRKGAFHWRVMIRLIKYANLTIKMYWRIHILGCVTVAIHVLQLWKLKPTFGFSDGVLQSSETF